MNAFKRKISLAHEEAAKQKMAKIDPSSGREKLVPSEMGKDTGNAVPSTDEKTDNMDTENNNEKTATMHTGESISDPMSKTDQETGEVIQEGGGKAMKEVDAEHMDAQEPVENPIQKPVDETLTIETSVLETFNAKAPNINTLVVAEKSGEEKMVTDDDDVIIVETSGESEKMDADENSSSVGATTRTASERDETSRNSFEKGDVAPNPIIANIIEDEIGKSPMRRGSQESSTTTTTTTTTTTGSDSTSSSSESTSTDSSSSDSDDTSSSEDDLNKVSNWSFSSRAIRCLSYYY